MELELLVPTLFAVFMTYNYGSAFGYAAWHVHDPIGAAFYGGTSMFIGSMLAGRMLLAVPARHAFNAFGTSVANARLKWERQRYHSRPAPDEDLRKAIGQGRTMVYVGLVDRDFNYTDQRLHTERITVTFTLMRNTMAMTPRERDATEILEELDRHGYLGSSSDDLRFAMTWGDGRCVIECRGFKAKNRMLHQNGIHTVKALIAREAEARGISVEGAIIELFCVLQAVASAEDAPKPIKDLLKRFQTSTNTPAGPVVLR